MSYRLIDANDLNGKISAEDYEVVLNAPCIYATIPSGLDGSLYCLEKEEKSKPKQNKLFYHFFLLLKTLIKQKTIVKLK